MYTIDNTDSKLSQNIVVSNKDGSNRLVISLTEGGRVKLYKHENLLIVSDLENSGYNTNYASAILFPFANRIEDGKYQFKSKVYQLPCNEVTNSNAIHGLVYNKTFQLLNEDTRSNSARIELKYIEENGCEGFPFKYSVLLRYIISNDGLKLKMTVKNEDESTFPFTLGWHPYFISSDLSKSELFFNCREKFITNKRGIVTGKERFEETMPVKLAKVKFDDAFTVGADMVTLSTPDYKVQINSSLKENNLQIYTPPNSNGIALEPMVGVSNSFNNSIGLKTLDPNKSFEVEWDLKVSCL